MNMREPEPIEVAVPCRIALFAERVAEFFCELPAPSQARVFDVIARTMVTWENCKGATQREAIASQLTPSARDWITALATLLREDPR